MRYIALFLFISLTACSLFRTNEINPRLPSAVTAQDPTFEDLKIEMAKPSPLLMSDVLQKLDNKFPSYMQYHTLAYQSLSMHESNFKNPRAIVFGNSGNMIMTFNGSADERHFANLEIATYTPEKGFEFREITFLKEPGAEPTIGAEEIDYKNENVVVSKPNPRTCVQCHGPENIRPIWQPYFVWPGMYGSDDDQLFQNKDGHSVVRTATVTGTDYELEGFQEYLKFRSDNPRYKVLGDQPQGHSVEAFSFSPYGYGGADQFTSKNRPNLTLMALLYKKQDEQIFNELMKKSPTTDQLYLFARTFCDSFAGAVNDDVRDIISKSKSFAQKNLSESFEMRNEDVARMQKIFRGGLQFRGSAKPEDIARGITNEIDKPSTGSLAKMTYALRPVGLRLEDYAINVQRYPVFTGGSGVFQDLGPRVIHEILKRTGGSGPDDCTALFKF